VTEKQRSEVRGQRSEEEIESSSLPNGWEIASLNDIADVIMGQSPPSATYNGNGIGLPFFQGKAEFTELHPVAEKWCSKPNKVAIGNDILLSVRAPVGATNIADRECCIGRGLAAVRYRHDHIFIYYYLRSIERKLDEKGTGTTFRAISGEVIRNTTLFLPPLPEQQRIVAKIEELFSDLDKGIENLKAAQQQLKVYRQAVLKWAFEGKMTNKNVVDGALPKGWKWAKLGEVCTNVEYGSAAKSRETGKVPVLRMGNIQSGKFDWHDLVYTDDDVEINKYLLKENDVLFNRTNSPEWVGKTAMYKGERPAIFAGYLIRINRIEALIDASYLTYYLNSHIARKYGNSVKSFGVNQANINGTKLKSYPLPLPFLSEQKAIVAEIESRLSVCDKVEETIEQSLKQAEALRQSFLKKAFEGKLVPQDPNDEPASELLERIRKERAETLPSRLQKGRRK
jgi:type I restriction enzyme S subunit